MRYKNRLNDSVKLRLRPEFYCYGAILIKNCNMSNLLNDIINLVLPDLKVRLIVFEFDNIN